MTKFVAGQEFTCEYNGSVRNCIVERDEGTVVRVRILPSTPGLNGDEMVKAKADRLFRSFLISKIKFI